MRFENDRLSISEPDLAASKPSSDRFAIKHPHEYISVDQLKFYRRRKPPDFLTKSSICLSHPEPPQAPSLPPIQLPPLLPSSKDVELPNATVNTEYRSHFQSLKAAFAKTLPLRRSTSLRLEGLMPYNRSEHQDCFHWFSPEDWRSCRSFPMRKPESLRLVGHFEMEPEYRSSYISYPMVDKTMKILPREMFRIHSPPKPVKVERQPSAEVEIIQKLKEDKAQRERAAEQQQECHLQRRAITDEGQPRALPSEYKRQYVPLVVEKAHSIPQQSHIKMQGNFQAVPEYQDSFKMYANYAKPEPIRKADNLRTSGSEMQSPPDEKQTMPEYREKFHKPPMDLEKEKPLKTEDHLRPNGEFSKDVPEYYESFRDPQVRQVPEKGKCREPYLHLKGKIEFNPEYRNTYLDFPRARPVVNKPTSSFRLPNSNSHQRPRPAKSPTVAVTRPSQEDEQVEPNTISSASIVVAEPDLTNTPEYRKAAYNYQIRERSPVQKAIPEMPLPSKDTKKYGRKSPSPLGRANASNYRSHKPSILDSQSSSPGMENMRQYSYKPPRFGRRAGESALRNAQNCRSKTSIIEGNPKYTMSQRKPAYNSESIHDSFVVLDNKPCRRTHWMN